MGKALVVMAALLMGATAPVAVAVAVAVVPLAVHSPVSPVLVVLDKLTAAVLAVELVAAWAVAAVD